MPGGPPSLLPTTPGEGLELRGCSGIQAREGVPNVLLGAGLHGAREPRTAAHDTRVTIDVEVTSRWQAPLHFPAPPRCLATKPSCVALPRTLPALGDGDSAQLCSILAVPGAAITVPPARSEVGFQVCASCELRGQGRAGSGASLPSRAEGVISRTDLLGWYQTQRISAWGGQRLMAIAGLGRGPVCGSDLPL